MPTINPNWQHALDSWQTVPSSDETIHMKPTYRLPSPFMKMEFLEYEAHSDSVKFRALFYPFKNVKEGDSIGVCVYNVSGPLVKNATNMEQLWKFVTPYFKREFENWQDENDLNWTKKGDGWHYVPSESQDCHNIPLTTP